jgi:hypothetical protein
MGVSIMRRRNDNAMATLLGWFSIALGLHQLLRPRAWTRGFGTRNRAGLVRSLFGAREVAAGLGLLFGKNPAPFFASRVAGDALDLATLGRVLVSRNGRRGTAAAALLAVLGITLLDVLAAKAARSR